MFALFPGWHLLPPKPPEYISRFLVKDYFAPFRGSQPWEALWIAHFAFSF